jgi:hypothetical protein
MTPYEEGQQAAREGRAQQECPYAYSRLEPSMDMVDYLRSEAYSKRDEWMQGWFSLTPA